jgi:RNA polymerase sigma-70 factor (sigma-E family)
MAGQLDQPPPAEPGLCVNTDMADDFDAWVHARAAGLARSALLLAGDVQLAEDMVQETLTRVAQRWTRLVRRGDPNAYAHRVLHHVAIDAWRRRERRPREVGSTTVPLDDGRAVRESDETAVDRRLLMREALGRLTAKQRAVLILRYYEDFTERQTAEVLGCSPNTVKSQARQALARLRELAPDLLADLDGRSEVRRP